MAAVAVVVGVGAGQNYQKEKQFRALNQLNKDVKVRLRRAGCATHMSFCQGWNRFCCCLPGLPALLCISEKAMQATCRKMLRALRGGSAQRRLSAAPESVLHRQCDPGHCV